MRRLGVLAIVTVLTVTGCGGGSGKPPAAAATTAAAGHGDPAAQTAVLKKAVATFRAARTGTYESQVTADGFSQPLAHETGSYSLEPVAASLERSILGVDEPSSAARVQVVRVRRTTDGHAYLQLKEWGSWTGCWMKVGTVALSRQTGIDLAGGSGLPTAIDVLARARVTHDNGLAGPHLAVDGYRALQFLGVSTTALAPYRTALTAVSVPVLLDLTADGDPAGAAVEGTLAAKAIKAAGTSLPTTLRTYVTDGHAEMALSGLGQPVHLAAPGTDLMLPHHVGAKGTCPANR